MLLCCSLTNVKFPPPYGRCRSAGIAYGEFNAADVCVGTGVMLGAMVACIGCGLKGVMVANAIVGVGSVVCNVSVAGVVQLVIASTNKRIESRIFMIAIITCGHSPEHGTQITQKSRIFIIISDDILFYKSRAGKVI